MLQMERKEREGCCKLHFNLRLFKWGKLEAEEEPLTAADGKNSPNLKISGKHVIIITS
jgi:hypothetical protein